MWSNNLSMTVNIDFTVDEMKTYLKQLGYVFVELCIYKYNSEEGIYYENISCPIKDKYNEPYWMNSKIQSDKEAIRRVFEIEMKYKLLKL